MTRTPYRGGGLDAAVRVADGSLGDADRTVAETRERATPAGQLALERQQRVVRAPRVAGDRGGLYRRLVLHGSGARWASVREWS